MYVCVCTVTMYDLIIEIEFTCLFFKLSQVEEPVLYFLIRN